MIMIMVLKWSYCIHNRNTYVKVVHSKYIYRRHDVTIIYDNDVIKILMEIIKIIVKVINNE